MARFLKVILVILVLLVIAVLALPFVIPAETIKNRVLAQIQAKTGRTVTMGEASFTLFPTLGLSAKDVTFGNPAWAGGGSMAQMKSLKVGLALMPLLHKDIQLENLTLDTPVITLIKHNGHGNWEMGQSAPATSNATASTPAASPAPRATIPDLHLDMISITNGSVSYKDDTGQAKTVSDINLTFKAPTFREKVEASLSALYEGKKSSVTATLTHPFTLTDVTAWETGATTGVSLKGNYGELNFSWDGTAAPTKSGVYAITGKLDIPSLDTAALSGGGNASAGTSHAQAAAAAEHPPENASRWSDAPIRLDALKSVNADLNVTIGKLVLPKVTLDNIATHVLLTGGVLQTQTDSIKAFDGTISLALNATQQGTIGLTFNASGANAETLLHDLAGYDKLSGTIDAEAKLGVAGNSERAYINSLQGTMSLHCKDGKLKGVNLQSMLRNLAVGAQGSDDASTSFSEFSASFSVSRGIATTNDLKLESPQLRMSGAGSADLPNWQQHFIIKPMLVASGSGDKAQGVTVPVTVEGSLNHPQYHPDVAAALQENLKDPKQLERNVKDLRKTLLNKDALKGLLR